MSTQMNNENNPNPEEKTPKVGSIPATSRIECTPMKFEVYGRSSRISHIELAKKIHAALDTVFHDFRGVDLFYVPERGRLDVHLYFQHNIDDNVPEGKIRSVISASDMMISRARNGEDWVTKGKSIYNGYNNKAFTLNDETRLLLSDFMYGGREANTPNSARWNSLIQVIPDTVGNNAMFRAGASNIYVRVTGGVQLERLLQLVYGKKMVVDTEVDAVNNNVEYAVETEVKYCYHIGNVVGNNLMLNIEQFDDKKVREFVMREQPIQNRSSGITFY